jgi:two-component system, NtrC family, response regulator AtoC
MTTAITAMSRLETPSEQGFVWGQSAAIQSVNKLMVELAQTNISFLLVGESGTGKDAYAKAIHFHAGGKLAQFKKIVCAGVSPQQLLHELQRNIETEKFETLSWTVFLDEVEMLSTECQRQLLTHLSDGRSEAIPFIRLVSATTCDLAREVEEGRFRRELYFRLNGACLRLPPLCERSEDVALLTTHFLNRHAEELKKQPPTLNHETTELLLTYHWPGNIRELENATRKMVALGDAFLALSDLRLARLDRSARVTPGEGSSLKMAARAASRQTERELILRALQRTKWNRKRAAQELQISYKSLLYKLKQIETPGAKSDE